MNETELVKQIRDVVKSKARIDHDPDCQLQPDGFYVYQGYGLTVVDCCFENFNEAFSFVLNTYDGSDMRHRLVFYPDKDNRYNLNAPDIVLVTGEFL